MRTSASSATDPLQHLRDCVTARIVFAVLMRVVRIAAARVASTLISMLTLAEAAACLGVQPGTLRVQIAKGKLKAKKMGRDWFVSEREVERYARENRR